MMKEREIRDAIAMKRAIYILLGISQLIILTLLYLWFAQSA